MKSGKDSSATYHHSYKCHNVCRSYDLHRLYMVYPISDHLYYKTNIYKIRVKLIKIELTIK